MNSFKVIKNLKRHLKAVFSSEKSGHDFSHLERVLKHAIKIQKKEGGDLSVIAISALLHDVHRLMSNKLGYFVYPEDSLDVVEKILVSCLVKQDEIKKILSIIKNHENKQDKNHSLEVLIVQDADCLDAVGKTGLKRCLKYCKVHHIPITNTNYPLNCKEYIPDINPISACHYIYRTMIPNAKNLYTKTAKELAKNKIKTLENFLKKSLGDNYEG